MASSESDSQTDNQTSTEFPEGIGITQGEMGSEVTKDLGLSDKLMDEFTRFLHWKKLPLIVSALIAFADIYLSFSQGIRTAISALAAEGTLTLALVAYLQMRQTHEPPSI